MIENPRSSVPSLSKNPWTMALLALVMGVKSDVDRTVSKPLPSSMSTLSTSSAALEVIPLENAIEAKIRAVDQGMVSLEKDLLPVWDHLPTAAQDRLRKVFDFYQSNKDHNPYRNLETLRDAYTHTQGAMNGRPQQVGDFYFSVVDMPNKNTDANYRSVERHLELPPEFKIDAFIRKITVAHEVDHALSWAERLVRSGKTAEAFKNQFILTEEAARYALMLEVINAKMKGRLREEAQSGAELTSAFRLEFAAALGLTPQSPGVGMMWTTAHAYFGNGGELHNYPKPLMTWLCSTYKEQMESQGVSFMPYVEKTEGLGDMVPYSCPSN